MKTSDKTFDQLLKLEDAEFLNVQDVNGDTYLHYLVRQINDPNVINKDQLHKSVYHLNSIGEMGLINIRNNAGKTPLELAAYLFNGIADKYKFIELYEGDNLLEDDRVGIELYQDEVYLLEFANPNMLPLRGLIDQNLYDQLEATLRMKRSVSLDSFEKQHIVKAGLENGYLEMGADLLGSERLLQELFVLRGAPVRDLSSIDAEERKLDENSLRAIMENPGNVSALTVTTEEDMSEYSSDKEDRLTWSDQVPPKEIEKASHEFDALIQSAKLPVFSEILERGKAKAVKVTNPSIVEFDKDLPPSAIKAAAAVEPGAHARKILKQRSEFNPSKLQGKL